MLSTKDLYLILDNVRSAENVGAMLRTADAFGIKKVFLCGITPYPNGLQIDERLPHVIKKTHAKISKTSLGAERTVTWSHELTTNSAVKKCRELGAQIVALEQTNTSKELRTANFSNIVALIVGPERFGMDKDTIQLADLVVEIPMLGKKESLNAATATGVALYHLRFAP